MDILISSNLERLLYLCAGAQRTAAYMSSLNKTGAYTVDADVKAAIDASFKGYFADEEKTAATIREIMERYNYLADTHTAVALSAAKQYVEQTGDKKPMVVASTASPYKFAADVYASLFAEKPADALAALDELAAKTNTEIPYPLKGIGERTVRFTDVVASDKMWDAVQNYVK
jgi:threonine synthase